ncbi:MULTISPECIES: DUF5317 domain-containing protein [unclassified Frankia]|uniref:DUF5317 domain-containing protein n=1 Tax=unclassified Frankia TaxID=2632575 RepID=UPI001F2AAF3F|nr:MULTISPECIES: DUF5317 domain-containing protein [unclassified Frankia]
MGLARGGTLDALSRVYVARPPLFVAAVAVLAVGRLIGPLHGPAWILASACLVVFTLTNRRLPGLGLLCAGVILNAAVINANGGDMPVSAWAADRAGVPIEEITASHFHTVADSQTSLRLLSDILPLPMPGSAAVVSFGDVLMAAGLGLFGGVGPARARRTLQARMVAGLDRPRRTANADSAERGTRAGGAATAAEPGRGTVADEPVQDGGRLAAAVAVHTEPVGDLAGDDDFPEGDDFAFPEGDDFTESDDLTEDGWADDVTVADAPAAQAAGAGAGATGAAGDGAAIEAAEAEAQAAGTDTAADRVTGSGPRHPVDTP